MKTNGAVFSSYVFSTLGPATRLYEKNRKLTSVSRQGFGGSGTVEGLVGYWYCIISTPRKVGTYLWIAVWEHPSTGHGTTPSLGPEGQALLR